MENTVVRAEVAAALAGGAPVVALESTIISHGLPRPSNLNLARELERIVRARGGVPATIAVLDGIVRIGLDDSGLTALAGRDDIAKLSVRDLAPVLAAGRSGATTVSATAHLAARVGIRVFATGGLGGVHRVGAVAPLAEAHPPAGQWDVSADLDTLARTQIAVVCSGVKSLLDIPATLERLETLGVPIIGYRTDEFPAFYLASSGHRLDWRVESPASVADILRIHAGLGGGGLLVVNPVPAEFALDPDLHDTALAQALTSAEAAGVRGGAVTPFVLARLQAATDGAALAANIALAQSNAELAAQIALALAGAG